MWDWIKKTASGVADWAQDHHELLSTVAAVAVGTLVTVAAAAFIVGTGGLGAGVLAAAVAGGIGGAAGGVTGYLAGVGLDPKQKFSGRALGKAFVVGLVTGAITCGVVKGVGGLLGGTAAQATEQAAARATAQEIAKRVAVNSAVGGVTNTGGQVVSNAVENVIDGAPITSNLGRGTGRAFALGVGLGAATTVLEPVTNPVLETVANRAARAGARAAGKTLPTELGSAGDMPPTGVAPSEPTGTGAAPESASSPAKTADAPTPEARGPPQQSEIGLSQRVAGEEAPSGQGGSSDGQPSANTGEGGSSAGEPNSPAAAPENQVAQGERRPTRERLGEFGQDEPALPPPHEPEVPDCGQRSLEGMLRNRRVSWDRVNEAVREAKRGEGRADQIASKATEIASALETLTDGRNPSLRANLKGRADVTNFIERNVPVGGKCIVAGLGDAPQAGVDGHFVVAENTSAGVVFRDYQVRVDGPVTNSFADQYPSFTVIWEGQ